MNTEHCTETKWGTLLPATAAHLSILQKIDSPLLHAISRMGDLSAPKPDEESIEDMVETFFVFTKEPPELRALLAKGRQEFREEAMRTIGDRLAPMEIGDLSSAFVEHFARASS